MIREASVLDIPRINELGELLNSNFRNVYSINEMLNEEVSKVIVYEKDLEVVGFIIATDLKDTCDILSIVVDPKCRREKIGTNLMGYLIGELDPKCMLVTLEVATQNKAAIGLYEKFGFEVVHVRKNYYKDDDAYLMARKSE